jgi:hypothetical protein
MTRQKLASLKLQCFNIGRRLAAEGLRQVPPGDLDATLEGLDAFVNALFEGYQSGVQQKGANSNAPGKYPRQ